MNKKLIRKMLTAAGGPLRIKFTPEQIALFESYATRIPGMNNSGGNRYREEGVLALQHLEQEVKRKEEEIKSRMEMRPTPKRKATTAEKLQGKKDEYELIPLVVGMSGADPFGEFVLAGVGLNGIGALAKTGLWNVTKYAPATQLGNWGRGYFVGNTFKNSFNGSVPILTPLLTSKNLFRTKVYKGGEIEDPYSNFLTTDPEYAANYGKVSPYIFESKSIAKAKEPMMGSSDPVTMDMFVYNNTKGNPNATAIIGHDAVTGEFTPSKGIEIYSMSPTNLFKINNSEKGRIFTGFKELQALLDMMNNSYSAPHPPIYERVSYSKYSADAANPKERDLVILHFKTRYPNSGLQVTSPLKISGFTYDNLLKVGELPLSEEGKAIADVMARRMKNYKLREGLDPNIAHFGGNRFSRSGIGGMMNQIKNDKTIAYMPLKNSDNYGGLYEGGEAFLKLNPWRKKPYIYSLIHEGVSHMTDDFVNDLRTPVSGKKLLSDLSRNFDGTKASDSMYGRISYPNDIYDEKLIEKILHKDSMKAIESRSTNWEMITDLYRILAKEKGISYKLATELPDSEFGAFIEKTLDSPEKLSKFMEKFDNLYLLDYSNLMKAGTKELANQFYKRIKGMLKYGPSLITGGYFLTSQKQGGKMNIIKLFKDGGQVRRMQTAAGGPINYKKWDNRKITSYTIPYIKEKAVKLTNAGKATGAKLSTNLLDSIADNAYRAKLPIRKALGIAFKESTFGNPTDDKSAWNSSSKIRKLFNGKYPGTYLHINNGRTVLGQHLINYHKGDVNHEVFYEGNPDAHKSIILEAFEFYKQHPDKYNPGQKNYQLLINKRGDEAMLSPEILKWYKDWEKSKIKIFKPEPYKINTNMQDTILKFIPYSKQGGKMNILKGQNGFTTKMIEEGGMPSRSIRNNLKRIIRERLYNNVNPRGYNRPVERFINAVIFNKPTKGYHSKVNVRRPSHENSRDPIFAEYLLIDPKKRKSKEGYTLNQSKYSPSIGNENNVYYIAPTANEGRLGRELLVNRALGLDEYGKMKYKPVKIGESKNTTVLSEDLGEHTISRGYDDKGEYVSYYDKWDLAPIGKLSGKLGIDQSLGIGKPLHFYDRIYLDDYYESPVLTHSTYLPEVTIKPFSDKNKNKKAKWVGDKLVYFLSGGMLEFLKKGSGIHIKKKNRGKFTEYCGGTVTDECIRKAKASGNPTLVKRATFAANARKWKHLNGGILLKYLIGGYILPQNVLEATSNGSAAGGLLQGFGKVMSKILPEWVLKAGTYVSPLNYAAAISKGSVNPKVGEEVVSKWHPNLLLIARTGEAVFGGKAIKNTPKAVVNTATKTGKNYIVSRRLNKAIIEKGINKKELLDRLFEDITGTAPNYKIKEVVPEVYDKAMNDPKYIFGKLLYRPVEGQRGKLVYRTEDAPVENYMSQFERPLSIENGSLKTNRSIWLNQNRPYFGMPHRNGFGTSSDYTYVVDANKFTPKLTNVGDIESVHYEFPATMKLPIEATKRIQYDPVLGQYTSTRFVDAPANAGFPTNASLKFYERKKLGGKMNILEFLKKGSGIHIKKENRGKFTDYCGGKVTSACIAKGKSSSNPAIRKRATFAANARKWKHKEGGIIKADEGTKLLKLGNTLNNSGLGEFLINGLASYKLNRAQNNYIDNYEQMLDASIEMEKTQANKLNWKEALLLSNQFLLDNYDPENPNKFGGVFAQVIPYLIYNMLNYQTDWDFKNKKVLLKSQTLALKDLNTTNFITNLGGLAISFLGNIAANKKLATSV